MDASRRYPRGARRGVAKRLSIFAAISGDAGNTENGPRLLDAPEGCRAIAARWPQSVSGSETPARRSIACAGRGRAL
jgi:hypothetical protein